VRLFRPSFTLTHENPSTSPGPHPLPASPDRCDITLCKSRSDQSARLAMLAVRRSGILLRHSVMVAPLLSLNGTPGISFLSRLSLNRDRLCVLMPTPSGFEQTLGKRFFLGNQTIIEVNGGAGWLSHTLSRPSQTTDMVIYMS
jgi:hypothetical protein